ncbi:YciI family protein [Nocardioides dongkuii]|uniref:YciI family protein n=1 Tax=Nocardioides dongkuii TaxID=2760089 RepID=UPI0015F9D9B3|nr:YciI family protein [Nocardioides dongkuii]
MTEYAVLLPGDEDAWESLTPEEQAAVFAQHAEFSRLLEERGHRITGGAELTHSRTARTVRRTDDGAFHVTDGPYAEAVEQLSGFYLVESDDLDDLLEVCRVLIATGEAVEVRAVVDHSGDAA